MKVSSIEIESQKIRGALFGCARRDVELMRSLASGGLADAAREIDELKRENSRLADRVRELESLELTLKDTISTAHRMCEEFKSTASKEAELIVAEAHLRADDLTSQARARLGELHAEIAAMRRQRVEFEASLKALVDYHSHLIEVGETEAKRSDEEFDKLRHFPR